jgi:hypothetical protein
MPWSNASLTMKAIGEHPIPRHETAVCGWLPIDRLARVRDVHEGGARRAADQRILATGQRIGPSPDVIPAAAADLGVRQKRHEVDVAAGVGAGHPVDACRFWLYLEARHRLRVRSLGTPA